QSVSGGYATEAAAVVTALVRAGREAPGGVARQALVILDRLGFALCVLAPILSGRVLYVCGDLPDGLVGHPGGSVVVPVDLLRRVHQPLHAACRLHPIHRTLLEQPDG